jgi:hypothetical protein
VYHPPEPKSKKQSGGRKKLNLNSNRPEKKQLVEQKRMQHYDK